ITLRDCAQDSLVVKLPALRSTGQIENALALPAQASDGPRARCRWCRGRSGFPPALFAEAP
ncbi:MAG: hypothetical protein KGJ80_13640, partial [Chloroflexota bacterium]|nr:hypothetical protein [Chloroflexota bacterium]